MAQYDHQYLFDLYPQYNYNAPTRPWAIHCRDNDGIRNCAWQMKAFHYFWLLKMCQDSGEIGLSINIDNLPFCIHADSRPGNGHIFTSLPSIHKLFNGEKFPLIVASALIPYYPCENNTPKCDGAEVARGLDDLATLLKPSGVLIAAIMDETGPMNEGRSLRDSSYFTHAWTSRQFEKAILGNISGELFDIEEFDTMKNDLSFNFVLRKK